MNLSAAREMGRQLSGLLEAGQVEGAVRLPAAVLAQRTSFRLLDAIGEQPGAMRWELLDAFLTELAGQKTMGGWVVIASLLRQQLPHDLPGAFERCRLFTALAATWYASDIFGERVPGPALVMDFQAAHSALSPWQQDPNRWVRRMVGVAVHYWAKRSRGAPALRPQASQLLELLAVQFAEQEIEVIKGVGWGLKTVGRYYPDLAAGGLLQQVSRPHRALMLRKALTYLPADQRKRITGRSL